MLDVRSNVNTYLEERLNFCDGQAVLLALCGVTLIPIEAFYLNSHTNIIAKVYTNINPKEVVSSIAVTKGVRIPLGGLA